MRLPFLLALFVALIVGQPRVLQAEPIEPTREQMQLQVDIMRDQIQKLESELKNVSANDPELEKAYFLTKVKQYQYIRDIMDVNLAVLKAQQFASNVTLWLVAIVTIAGIAFAGFQLWKSVTVAGIQI